MSELRTVPQRKADILKALAAERTGWLATADHIGRAHLIVVAFWWSGQEVVITTTDGSRTARNLKSAGRARLGLGTAEDVIMIDATLTGTEAARRAAAALADGFAAAAGWDPRQESGDWVFFRLRPSRIEAYRGYGELQGREVMRDGGWLA